MFSDKLNEIAERYPLWTLLLVLRVPLLVITGYALMVSDWLVEDVAFEAVRYVVLDRPYQLYLIGPLLLLAGFAVRFCGETMIDLVTPNLRRMRGPSGFVVWFLPGLLASLIGILTGAEFINVALDKNDFGTDNPTLVPFAPSYMNQPAALAGAAYISIGIFVGLLPTRWISSVGNGFAPFLRIWNTSARTHATAFALLATAVGVFFLFADWTNPKPAQYVGSFGVIALWAFAAVLYFSPFALLSHVAHTPVLLCLITAAFLFSAFNLNDNHEFRTFPGDTNPDGTMYFQQNLSLESWLKARENIDLYKYDRYPIFIVAAEGGGLRSAYFTDRVLMTLQTVCPSFALHTIAISGVSGGSVGATSFVARIKDQVVPVSPRQEPCLLPPQEEPAPPVSEPSIQKPMALVGKPPPFARGVGNLKMYEDDYLAPLLSGALFPDALQRLLWWSVPEFDRARAIECAFERGLKNAAQADPKEVHNYLGEPCSDGSLRLGDLYRAGDLEITPPHLFLSTTSVNTGAPLPVATRRVEYPRIRSPIPMQSTDSVQSMMNGAIDGDVQTGHPTDFSQPPIEHPIDLPLTTAAFLSARFPFVLPPARFPLPKENGIFVKPERLLDGGLFENSGTWYAEQLVRSLLRELRALEDDRLTREELKLPAADDAFGQAEERFRQAMERVQIFVLVIRSTPCADKRWSHEFDFLNDQLGKTLAMGFSGRCVEDTIGDPTLSGFSELGSPGRALLNTRIARGHDAQDSLGKLAQEHKDRVFVDEIRFMNAQSVHIPLTWSMSRESRRLMDYAVAKIQPDNWERHFEAGDQLISLGQEGWAPPTYRRIICALLLSKRAVRMSLQIPDRVASRCAQVGVVWHDPPVTPPDLPPPLPEVDRCEGCDPKKP